MSSLEFRIDFDESLTELLANFNIQFLSASVEIQNTMEELRMATLHIYLCAEFCMTHMHLFSV